MFYTTIWEQQYNPLSNIFLSALVALAPLLLFIICLVFLKLKGYYAGLISTLVAGILAITVYKMPTTLVIGSAAQGVLGGLWPVASIVIAAIFLYKLTVKIKFFDTIQHSIASISEDKRIQVLLIAYSFGAFLEGAAGFGAPVAITAAILVGLGFNPLMAATICLVANIAGGAYGAMGIPVTVPAALTNINPLVLSQATAIVLPIISLIVAFVVVFLVDGFKGIKEVFPAILVSGGSFGITQYILLTFIGAELVNVTSAIVSLVALFAFLRFWKPKNILTNDKKEENISNKAYSGKEIAKAWSPFIFLTILVTLINTPFFKALVADANPKTGAPAGLLNSLIYKFEYFNMNETVAKVSPVVEKATPIKAIFTFNPFTSTTSAILLAAIITIIIFKVKGSIVANVAKETILELWAPILTICSVLALANISTYSGMSSTLGLAFANTGNVFPLLSPILGWIGVFLTGSVVNSGSLFAGLQSVTATQLSIDPSILVGANVMGGAIAKMISPQSIAVAAAAVGLVNQDSKIFSKTIKLSVALLVVICIANYIISL